MVLQCFYERLCVEASFMVFIKKCNWMFEVLILRTTSEFLNQFWDTHGLPQLPPDTLMDSEQERIGSFETPLINHTGPARGQEMRVPYFVCELWIAQLVLICHPNCAYLYCWITINKKMIHRLLWTVPLIFKDVWPSEKNPLDAEIMNCECYLI